jgi:hypothetical protein
LQQVQFDRVADAQQSFHHLPLHSLDSKSSLE